MLLKAIYFLYMWVKYLRMIIQAIEQYFTVLKKEKEADGI